MTEHDHALHDLRSDIIIEVADSMPDASARQMVAAIVHRVGAGLPTLVEVEIDVAPYPPMSPDLTEMEPCSDLEWFADGELDSWPGRESAFLSHLPSCITCRRGLASHLPLTTRLASLTKETT